MRILYFSRDYTTHDHRFLAAMANTGHQVYYLRLEAGLQVIEERSVPPEINVIEWSGGTRPAKLNDGLHLLSELQRILHKVHPDVVQAGPIQRCAFLTALAGFHPLVSMSWGYDLLQDASRNLFWGWATRYTLTHTDALVTDCATTSKLAISYGMAEDRIVSFPWGVDLNHFTLPTCKPSNLPAFSLLSTRSFEPIYGSEVIAHAFVIAARKRPWLKMVMLGGGSQWAVVRRILLVGGVFDRVQFPGLVPYADLPRFHQSADIYISASHSDGSSISMLEALACGTPVIISDIPGNQEWVTPGENGWLFPDGDADGLASAILKAMDERASLAEMGRKARRLAEARADWQKNFLQLEKAYALARKK